MAKTLAAYRSGLLNWYAQPISTGPLEGFNNKAQTMKGQAHGYRNIHFFMLKIRTLHRGMCRSSGAQQSWVRQPRVRTRGCNPCLLWRRYSGPRAGAVAQAGSSQARRPGNGSGRERRLLAGIFSRWRWRGSSRGSAPGLGAPTWEREWPGAPASSRHLLPAGGGVGETGRVHRGPAHLPGNLRGESDARPAIAKSDGLQPALLEAGSTLKRGLHTGREARDDAAASYG